LRWAASRTWWRAVKQNFGVTPTRYSEDYGIKAVPSPRVCPTGRWSSYGGTLRLMAATSAASGQLVAKMCPARPTTACAERWLLPAGGLDILVEENDPLRRETA
jgi:hypothetical protein